MLKKILLALMFVITAITSVTYAEDDMKTAASKAYVDTKIETKQLKIPAAGQPNVGAGETVMTYTATGNGEIGERGLYSDISSYNASTDGDKLITASALNATFTNLPTTPTTKLECANQADGCTLWTIVDQSAYSILPAGYTPVGYIESTAKIGLGFYTNQDSEIEAKWSRSSYAAQFVYQANTGASSTMNTTAYLSSSGAWRFGNKSVALTPTINVEVISVQNKTGVTFNGETVGTYSNVNNFTGNVEFGALGTSSGAAPAVRLSYIKHSQNGVLLGHYIACQRESDSAYGLCDIVGGQFYTNADATITAGPDM